jgi:hypothetical protein
MTSKLKGGLAVLLITYIGQDGALNRIRVKIQKVRSQKQKTFIEYKQIRAHQPAAVKGKVLFGQSVACLNDGMIKLTRVYLKHEKDLACATKLVREFMEKLGAKILDMKVEP